MPHVFVQDAIDLQHTNSEGRLTNSYHTVGIEQCGLVERRPENADRDGDRRREEEGRRMRHGARQGGGAPVRDKTPETDSVQRTEAGPKSSHLGYPQSEFECKKPRFEANLSQLLGSHRAFDCSVAILNYTVDHIETLCASLLPTSMLFQPVTVR